MSSNEHVGTAGAAGAQSEPIAAESGRSPLEELVDAARRGEEAAWRALYAQFTPTMRAQVRRYRLASSDVDDVVQFAWVQCFENRHRIRSAAALPGWLLTTCRNRALLVLREQRRCPPTEVVPEIPHRVAEPVGPLEVLLANEQHDALVLALRGLTERQRILVAALLETEHPGRVYHRIAEEIGMPIGSIGPTRLRAVAKLRQAMEPTLAA